jgi:FkbM family methyltransferase
MDQNNIKYSIIIPTYNHLEDCLKPCINSIIKYTDLTNVEVVIVANGCTDNTRAYVNSLGPSFKLVWIDEPAGYPRSTNEGIKASKGDYIILLNNDIILIEQNKNTWLNLLCEPLKDNQVGITGPVKFSFPCGRVQRNAMAFWCVAFRRNLIDEIGYLDEVFSPGMGEDGDFSIKTEIAGYKLVGVPNDALSEFGKPIKDVTFPIFHLGNGTFADNNENKNSVIERNTKILEERYSSEAEVVYNACLNHECDINGLFPKLRKYAQECKTIVEMGTRGVFSVYAFIAAKPKKITCYDIYLSPNIWEADRVAKLTNIEFAFIHKDVLSVEIEETDLLFIDTLHNYKQLKQELTMHSSKVNKYILMHDTYTFGTTGETEGSEGLNKAIDEFLAENKNWTVHDTVNYSNGLTVLKRIDNKDRIKYNSNAGKWIWYQGVNDKIAYGDDTTYKLGANFLKDCKTVEDWGCGTCYFSNFIDSVAYKGIDGSYSKFVNEIHDLATYVSPIKPDGLFMRHVIEHNPDWKTVLNNALKSFGKKFVLVLFTPINTVETKIIANNEQINVPDISFNMYEILDLLKEYKFNFEEIKTETQYGIEHIFYIEHQSQAVDITIIVPTYNHLEDALKPCLTNMLKYTSLINKEIIVVSNGSDEGTKEYLESLGGLVRYFLVKDPIGYIKAINYGIYASNSQHVITHDNDSILMSQPIDKWIQILQKPFLQGGVGASGPFASNYEDAGLVIYSGCTMYDTKIIKKIGAFDEIYNPGYLSDLDVSLKIWKIGYKCVAVPEVPKLDLYKDGIFPIHFPIVHTGEVQTMDKDADEPIIKKNRNMLYRRHTGYKIYDCFPFFNELDILKIRFEELYDFVDYFIITESPVTHTGNSKPLYFLENKEMFKKYSDKIIHRISPLSPNRDNWARENRQRTEADIALKEINANDNDIIISSDADEIPNSNAINEYLTRKDICSLQQINYHYNLNCRLEGSYTNAKICRYSDFKNIGSVNLRYCDQTLPIHIIKNAGWHFSYMGGYEKIAEKIKSFAHCDHSDPKYHTYIDLSLIEKNVNQYASVYGDKSITYSKTLDYSNMPLFIKNNMKYFEENKWIKERIMNKNIKCSIIIPTYNHLEDCLKPCIDSIIKYTNMDDIEVITVANGCTDGTKEYLYEMSNKFNWFKYIFVEEPLGYTKATNLGIKKATGEYVLLLNNDTEFLPQEQNYWLNTLMQPFQNNPQMAVTGPLKLFDNYAGMDVIIFFCAMIKKSMFDILGLLDEDFSPGGGEDVDFCAKAVNAGYEIMSICSSEYNQEAETNVGYFPVWHKDNRTFRDIPEYTNKIIKDNGLKNALKYNKNIKLNLGSGGIHIDGYLSVDLKDKRTHILMDACKLTFKDNSVSEIIASHLFEHISPYKAVDTLVHWKNILKPGCKLIMEMPNIEELCKAFLTSTKAERYGFLNCVYGAVNTTSEGDSSEITSPHLWGWYPEMLFDIMSHAGFVDIVFMKEQMPHPGFNFRVEAKKPMSIEDDYFEKTQKNQTASFDHNGKHIKINIFNDKEFISSNILNDKKFYEVQMLDQIAQHYPKHGTIVDAGANIGNHTVYFENYLSANKIISFEPCKANYEKLCSNIKKPSTIAYNLALSNKFGKCSIVRNEANNSGTGTVTDGNEVDVVTLDYFNIQDLTLLKIDVEGHELNVLQGAIETIKRCKPLIFMEVADSKAKELLINLGYKLTATFWYGSKPTCSFAIA